MSTMFARLARLTSDRQVADGLLLDAFLAGDQNAFATLVRRHAGLVFATCRRILRHQQDAEDAFQATFLVLARRAADVWPREAVGSWLFGVAHRVALKARAVRQHRTAHEQPLPDIAREETNVLDFDQIELVHRVICKLPEMYRAAVVACDLEGLSRKEAAERLGWTEGTLSGRLARARELLAKRFKRIGLTLPVGGLAAFAANETASATAIQSTIDLATGTTVGVPAAVVALTEGVMQSMSLSKMKALAAVIVCVMGFGAVAAFGAGSGTGNGDTPTSAKSAPNANEPPALAKAAPAEPPKPKELPTKPEAGPPRPRAELAQLELQIIRENLQQNAKEKKIDPAALELLAKRLEAIERLLDGSNAPAIAEKPSAETITDRDHLYGRWRVLSMSEDNKFSVGPKDMMIKVNKKTLIMPLLEGGKRREYNFTVDETKTPHEIDLIANNKPVGRGIYEFTAAAPVCASCHQHPFAKKGLPPPTGVYALCEPSKKDSQFMQDAGIRLALTLDGERPTKFGGAGVIVFELRREVHQAKADLQNAKEQYEKAWSDADTAMRRAEQAQTEFELAKQRLAIAEKNAEELKKPPTPSEKGDAEFTVHIRTLTATEKVIRVKSTGKETVLDGLTHVPDDVPLKPDTVNVWVVADERVIPVDLSGFVKGTKMKTNYVFKAGDQLFVQVKPSK